MTFYETLTAAIAEVSKTGFVSVERVEYWMGELRASAERTMGSRERVQRMLARGLDAVYRRLVERGGVARMNPGVSRFTIEKVKPHLRAELDRRVMASAGLIRLNRAKAIEDTLQRFAGWASSVPQGGSGAVDKGKTRKDIRKSLAQLPFRERRVLIDQGHKLTASISETLAKDGNALAGMWVSHFLQPGYNFRENHKERHGHVYAVRGNWAIERGLMKPSPAGYTDEITKPGEEVFCLPGDSNIKLFDNAEKIYRRWYCGPLVSVTTTSGSTISATPNHPIMTPNGRTAIGLLNESDHIFEHSDESIEPSKLNADQGQSTFAQLFDSMRQTGFPHKLRDGMVVDFHGDGTDEKVDIVSLARPLRFDAHAFLAETFDYFGLALADLLASSIGVVDELGLRFLCPANSFVGLSSGSGSMPFRSLANIPGLVKSFHDGGTRDAVSYSEIARVLSSFVAPPDLKRVEGDLLLATLAFPKVDQSVLVPLPNGHNANPDSAGDLINRLPFSTKASNVVKIERNHFSGHVYNLQTACGWYSANRVIVSNCRCYYRWIYNLGSLPADMLTKKGQAGLDEVRKAARDGSLQSA